MHLSKLKLWNFRQFGKNSDDLSRDADLEVSFTSGLNLLVGENDAGKSTIVDAINYIVTPYSHEYLRINTDDFFKDQERLKIECQFRGFSKNEAQNFIEFLAIDDHVVIPELESEELRESWIAENIKKFYLTLFLEVEIRNGEVAWYDLKTGENEDESVRFIGEIRQFLRSMYLKPLRNAKYELMAHPKSRLSKVLSKHKHFQESNTRKHPLTEIFEKANIDIKDFFKGTNPSEQRGKLTHDEIHNHLKNLFSKKRKKSAQFDASDPKLEQVLQKLSLELEEKKSGLGALNLLFIAVELLLLEREEHKGLHLGIIEEAEAHLHTQAQMRVLKYLQGLSETEDHPIQLIITTHSTHIASQVDLKNIILVNNKKCFSLKPEKTKLSKSDYAFLERFLDATKANLFFAEGVIMVEGDAENLLLPTIAHLIGKDLVDYGVSIVNVGHTGLFRYANIFLRSESTTENINQIDIPVACIKDNDLPYQEKIDGEIVFKDHTEEEINTFRLSKKYEEQKVRNFISPNKTLEFDISLDKNLREAFYQAVLYAHEAANAENRNGDQWLTEEKKLELNTQSTNDLESWSALSKENIAFNIYKKCEKNKTITAQFFAEILMSKKDDEEFIESLKNSSQINYILEAIEYVTNIEKL